MATVRRHPKLKADSVPVAGMSLKSSGNMRPDSARGMPRGGPCLVWALSYVIQLGINDLEAVAGGENAAKQLNLTAPYQRIEIRSAIPWEVGVWFHSSRSNSRLKPPNSPTSRLTPIR